MTTTLDTLMDNVESEMTTQLKTNVKGIRDIFFDDEIPVMLNFPSVHFQLNKAIPNDFETNDPPDIEDWIISYDVCCLSAGFEKSKSFKNARKFTNKVYNVLRGQKATGEFLNGNCLDIGIGGITYGYIELGQFTDSPTSKVTKVKGGVIELLLRVVEER